MKYIVVWVAVWWAVLSSAMAYDAKRWDYAVLNMIQEKVIDAKHPQRSKEDKQKIITTIESNIDSVDDPRIDWILWQVLVQIQNTSKPTDLVIKTVEVSPNDVGTLRVRSGPSYEDGMIGKLDVWDTADVYEEKGWFFRIRYDEQYAWIAVEYTHLAKTDNDDPYTIEHDDSNQEEKVYAVLPGDTIIKTVEVSPNDVGSLRVRLGPNATSEVIGKIDVWGQIGVYDEVDGYFLVDFAGRDARIAVEYTHLAGTEAPTHHLTPSPPAPLPNTPTSLSLGEGSTLSSSKKEFYEKYRPLVDTKDKKILWLCTKYYDEVDEIAREYDFPVELIIATWYREHTCKFYNPGNGRGNFQITSNYYTPGEISWSEFRSQVIDFIEFSRAKRDYYDAVQTYGPDPIVLSYDSFDLDSIRKHAIFYNGIVWELDTNTYANTNFAGVGVGGVDGIVTYFLKVLEWSIER